jgi:hypothetical protein
MAAPAGPDGAAIRGGFEPHPSMHSLAVGNRFRLPLRRRRPEPAPARRPAPRAPLFYPPHFLVLPLADAQ